MMYRALTATLTVLALTVACVKSTASDGGDTATAQTTTESGESSSTSASTSASTSSSDDTETDSGDEAMGFVPLTDLYGLCSLSPLSVCDVHSQDCPERQKCVPWHMEGCSSPVCVPVTGDKPAGESCISNEMAHDDCDADSWCYPGTLALEQPGVCIAFCEGTGDDSFCDDPSLTCVSDRTVFQGILGCRPLCDPLMPEGCSAWERCTFNFGSPATFGCLLGGGVPDGAVCQNDQDCDSGACVLAESLPECAGEQCCSPWCDIMAPNCAMGLECLPAESDDPMSNVGVCGLL